MQSLLSRNVLQSTPRIKVNYFSSKRKQDSKIFSEFFSFSSANKICLKEIEPDTLEILIDYMYTGEIEINVDNVQSVLILSSLLQLTNVKESCCEFLLAQMHVSNCLGIKAFADMYSCCNLLKQADAFIEQYFS